MSITLLLSAVALVAVLGIMAAIFIGGAVYVVRVRRHGIESVLAGARKHRELQA